MESKAVCRKWKAHMIDGALAYLRAEIIRDGGSGLEHVEALLHLRGRDLEPVPRKRPRRFRRGKLRLAIRIALREGPLPVREIVARVSDASGLPYEAIYASAYAQLNTMRRAGLVGREGKAWGLCYHPRSIVTGGHKGSYPECRKPPD